MTNNAKARKEVYITYEANLTIYDVTHF